MEEQNMTDYEKIRIGLGDLDEETVLNELESVISENSDAAKALQACQEGLEIVSQHFDTGRYFIGDLIFAGEIMREAVDILKPALAESKDTAAGKVVFCTVKGDVHDIGKNIVISLLTASGMNVIDLGVDVSPEKVVEAVRQNDCGIVALSGVLTLAIPAMKETVDALRGAGLREDLKIIIGGSPVTAEVCAIVGADFWTKNPQEGTKICLGWAKEQAAA
jgi:methanogenic corrinoid protein MtbC1